MATNEVEEDMDTSPDNSRSNHTQSLYPSLGHLEVSAGMHSDTGTVVQRQPLRASNQSMRQTNDMEKVDQVMDREMLTYKAPQLATPDEEEDLYTAGGSQASAAPVKSTSEATYHEDRHLKNDREAPLQSLKEPSKKPLPSPAPFDEGSFDAGQGRTQAEEPGVVYAMVACQWKDDKSKLKKVLQKVLQSWFNNNTNKHFKDTSCTVQSFSEDGGALIHIKPASVIDALLQLGGTELTTKDGQSATIQFHSSPVPAPGTRTPDSHLMDVPSSFSPATQDAEIPMEGRNGGAATAEQEPESFTLPLALFWYMNQAYKEEIKRIEGDNGVQIEAEVKVSFKVDQRAGLPNLNKVRGEFTDLVKSCLSVYDSRRSPLKDADPGDWMSTLKTLQRKEAMVVLTASSDECTVWGPRESLAVLPKSFTITKATPGNANISPSASAWGSPDASQMIGLNIEDPLISDGISLGETLWKLMLSSFHDKIANIEHKFGVKLEEEISQGRVKVRAKSTNGVEAAALKSHALRALLQLYQRVATSTMSCSLMAPNQAKDVEDKLKEISSRYPVIGISENFSSWRLMGLPENLGPAVTELEKLVGPVFKNEDKQRIGYSGYMSSAGAAKKVVESDFKEEDKQRIRFSGNNMSSARTTSMGGGATAGGTAEDNSDENCPICMDTFNNKQRLKCGHEFCKECLNRSLDSMGPTCPVCKDVFGKVVGDQPEGRMSWRKTSSSLPGFEKYTSITITYDIPTGTQTEKHPNPGNTYYGIQRVAYLPDNQEGREVLRLLERAFDQKLIFTVGTSRTTGADGVVTWNDIHHKTNMYGGPQSFGYPDPDYLSRVKEELKAKGIK